MGVQIPLAKGQFCWDDVGISTHAVDQLSDWQVDEAVECHIEFSQCKNPPCDAASFKIL